MYSPTASQRWVATIHGVASASFLTLSFALSFMQFQADQIRKTAETGNAATLPGIFLALAIAFMFTGIAKAMEFAESR